MTPPRFDFDFISRAIGAKDAGRSQGGADGVSTDTRTLKPKDLFCALIGPSFDGHRFLDEAMNRGAAGVVVSDPSAVNALRSVHPEAAVFRVDDTLRALGDLARAHRARFHGPVIAISGSSGKTTCKEIVAAILSSRYRVLKTEGNLNNLIGLPLTLLRRTAEEAAVLEAGMNHAGELTRLADIARPNVVVLTNVGTAHLEHFGTVEKIAQAKGELLAGLTPDDCVIVNLDDDHIPHLVENCPAQRITFSIRNPQADLFARHIAPTDLGYRVDVLADLSPLEIDLPLAGRHNISNLLAAMAAAHAVGTPYSQMMEGIRQVALPHGRLDVRRIGRLTLIDDAYNANPASMAAALETLADLGVGRRRMAILGDMLELGPASAELHREVGRKAAKEKVHHLLAFGEFSKAIVEGAREGGLDASQVKGFTEIEDLFEQTRELLSDADVVLIKASRGMRLERVVNEISRTVTGEG